MGRSALNYYGKAHQVSANLKLICAVHAYQGSFDLAAGYCGFRVEMTQKPPSVQGFDPQTGRWQVENCYRRLSRDYEKLASSDEAFIQLAFCDLILAKI